jgi:hypothetical protein
MPKDAEIPGGIAMKSKISLEDELVVKPNLPTTFVVKILHNKNASIQGYVKWLEREKTIPFRSLMEFIYLVEDALREDRTRTKDFRSWDSFPKNVGR